MDTTLIGTLVFIFSLAVVMGGYTFYRRNIKPGAESTNPHKFDQ